MSKIHIIFWVCLVAIVLAGIFWLNFFSASARTPTAPISQMRISPNSVSQTTTPASPSVVSGNTSFSKSSAAPSVVSTAPVSLGRAKIMAWIYPGDPTCSAPSEYSDGRKIDILKPEYFTLGDNGNLSLLTEQSAGCNGYSATNVANLKKYSNEQYATFSSNYAVTMGTFLTGALSDNTDINTLVSFVMDNNMTGIELDFEDFGGWTPDMYSKYKQFVTDLGNALHKNGKKLMIDGPAVSNQVEENWYAWRYADFVSLPIDSLVVMTYDYQYDQGVDQPISPIFWIQNTIAWVSSKFPDKTKLTFGIPSYGYKGVVGTQKFSLLTYDQISKESGFYTATRDPSSGEMTWQNGNNVYFYNDSRSMSEKLQAILNSGITSVSVWHLGGNLWFSKG